MVNERGDVERGFAESDVVVERFFRQSEVNAVSHEPRACVAVYENDACTLWCSVQDPYRLQDSTARVLSLPMEAVRVVSTNLGGAFGVKVTGRFAILCALLARKTGRPVKIWFTREEESLDSHNRSALTHYVKVGAKKTARLKRSKFERSSTTAIGPMAAWDKISPLRSAHGPSISITDVPT